MKSCVNLVLFSCLLSAADGQPASATAIVAKHPIILDAPVGEPTRFMPRGPLLGNGDVGVMQSGPADGLVYYIGKNDFWSIKHNSVIAVGQLRIETPALQGAKFQTISDMHLAEIRGEYVSGNAAMNSRAWVDANRNVLCVELSNKSLKPLTVAVKCLVGGRPVENDGFLHAPDAPDENGRKIGLATRVIGASSNTEFDIAPGKSVVVATAILSDLDTKGSDPLEPAKSLVVSLTEDQIAAYGAAHRKWWNDFWSRSFIEIPDKMIEQCWYASWYIMGSCSRAGKVAPGLWGNWLTVDNPMWHGDFHLNYNFQAPFYGLYSANHVDTTLPFYDAINQFIPRGGRIAQSKGWKGIHLPVSIGPWGMCPEGDDCDWGQRSNAAYAALPYIWYWNHTRDAEWLKTTGYEYLRETAAFWEDYLKFENGRYVIYNDSIHEGSGPDMNAILSLGLVRYLFKNIIPMSEALGVDADKRDKWRDIVEKISEFPLQERDGKTVFRYSEKGTAWWNDNTLGIQHIFPAGAIGLDSDPKLLEISHNTITAMGRWRDFNGSSSWYTACARVGYDPKKILAELNNMYTHHALPNKLLNFGGGGIENVSPALAITEMLLQSHEGVIRVFPCWPKDQDARFGTLRAKGAFLVSAEIKGGIISGLTITSEQGGDCSVRNPWPGNKVMLAGREPLSGDRLTFRTRPGETIKLIQEKH